jgi:hypothetical protein
MSFDEYLSYDKLSYIDVDLDYRILIDKIDLLENLNSVIIKNEFTVLDLIFHIRYYEFELFIKLVKYIWVRVQRCSVESNECLEFINATKPYLLLALDSEKFEFELSISDGESIFGYTGSNFSNINTYLRTGIEKKIIAQSISPENFKPLNFKQEAMKLDKILTSPKIPKTQGFITVFRGIDNVDISDFLNNLQIGEIYQQLSFSSTSFQLRTGYAFVGEICCLLRIILPPGIPCLYIKNYTEFKAEKEVLFPAGIGLVLVEKGFKTIFDRTIQMFTFECQYCTLKSRYHNLKVPEDWDHVTEQQF